MKENRAMTVMMTVIGIATLLVTLVSATFAYFTAKVTDNNPLKNDVTVTGATLGTISYTHGDTVTLASAFPGDSDSKTFTISSEAASTNAVSYDVYLVTSDNTFTTGNLHATLTGDSSNVTGKTAITSNLNDTSLDLSNYGPNSKVKIGSGVIQPNATTDTWTLKIQLVEANEEQNADQGATFTGKIEVVANIGYTAGGATTSVSGN